MFTEERKPSSLRHLHRNTYSTPQWGWLGGGYPLRWFLQPQENISSETSNPCTCFHPGKQPGCSWDGRACSAAKIKASPRLRGSACVWTVVTRIGTDLQVIKNQSNPLRWTLTTHEAALPGDICNQSDLSRNGSQTLSLKHSAALPAAPVRRRALFPLDG